MTTVSGPAGGSPTSLVRGLAWAIPLGIFGAIVPFALLAVETVCHILFTDTTPLEGAAELRIFAPSRVPSAIVCSLIFASAAVASFTPSRSVGLIRSLIVMALNAFVALIVAGVLSIMVGLFGLGNPKEAKGLGEWLLYDYPHLLLFPGTFLPGVIALTCWQIQIAEDVAIDPELLNSSRVAGLVRRPVALVELLLCVGVILSCDSCLRPVFSQARAQRLAEGVLLWNGKPLDGAILEFYPVLKNAEFGQSARQISLQTEPDGQFEIKTWPKWRERYSTVGEFAVTVSPRTEPGLGRFPSDKLEAIKKFALPQDTPIRVMIKKRERSGIRIDMGDYSPPRESSR